MPDLKNSIFPDIVGVYPLRDDHLISDAMALYGLENGLLDTDVLLDFVKSYQSHALPRLDDPENPVLIKDKSGRNVLCQIWVNPAKPSDPNYMVILFSPESKDSHGRAMYKPEKLFRGPLANVLIVGGMTCCGAAAQAHWTELDGGDFISEGRVPLTGLAHPEHARFLENIEHIATSNIGLNAMIGLCKDILAAQDPSNLRFKMAAEDRQMYQEYLHSAPTI